MHLSSKKLKFINVISLLALGSNLLLPKMVLGQQGSNIDISRTPYLSFVDLPESFAFNNISVPINDTGIVSDATINLSTPGAVLPPERVISISDTRASGGFNLQVTATDFSGGSSSIPNSGFRLVSSSAITLGVGDTVNNNVVYMNGFSGQQGLIAPLAVSATADFSDTTTFTSGAYAATNTLDGTVDLLQGCLTEAQGRNGEVGLGISYYLEVPKLTPPEDYNSTLTYTITDTTENPCS